MERQRPSEVLQGSVSVLFVFQGSESSVLQGTVRFFNAHRHAVGFSKIIKDLERLFQVLKSSQFLEKV